VVVKAIPRPRPQERGKSDRGSIWRASRKSPEPATLSQRFAAAGLAVSGFFVQEMAQSGHETIFGVSTDPRFGPVLMFGLGGKYVEVFRDVVFGITPLAPSEASEIVRRIRGVKLLEGVRGDAPSDIAHSSSWCS
jgi:hypothetical protein